MIGTHYKAHKDNVIDLYRGYKEKRGDINDGIDIDFLGSRIKSLEVGKYTLAQNILFPYWVQETLLLKGGNITVCEVTSCNS